MRLTGRVAAESQIAGIDGRGPATDDVRQNPRRTAGHGPAQRAVPGVEEQVCDGRRAQDGRAVRRPDQKPARSKSPAPGNRLATERISVARRASGRWLLKPETSAMPPIRIRVPSRVMAILKLSSMMVETGAWSSRRIFAVSE